MRAVSVPVIGLLAAAAGLLPAGVGALAQPAGTGVAADDSLLSPRLQRLRAEATPENFAVEAFWRERREAGAPMIEPIAGDASRVLVTFLWRGNTSVRNVSVIVVDQVQYDSGAWLERAKMEPLAGTDVWYRTYRMPCDLLFSYRFSVDDPETINRDITPGRRPGCGEAPGGSKGVGNLAPAMRKNYDFSKARRTPYASRLKRRVTMRRTRRKAAPRTRS